MICRFSILLLLFIISELPATGQDLHFSRFYHSPLTLNPALTGALNGSQRLNINYKSQWKSLGTAYKTTAISYDATLLKRKWPGSYLGAGISVFNDKAGDSKLSLLNCSASLSGIVALNDFNRLSTGMQVGYYQRSIRYEGLSWDNQFNGSEYDPSLPTGETGTGNSTTFIDLSSGISWSYGTDESNIVSNNSLRVNAGIAAFHINQPAQQFYTSNSDKLKIKYLAHSGAYIGFPGTLVSMLPSAVYMQQGTLREITFGSMFRYMISEESRRTGLVQEKAILLGGHYRLGDAFIPSVMFEFYDFSIAVSYDVNLSGLTPATHGSGGIEISLRYDNSSHLGTKPSLRFL